MKSGPVDWYTSAPSVPNLPQRVNRRLRSTSTARGPIIVQNSTPQSRPGGNGSSRRLRSTSTAHVPPTLVQNGPPQSGSDGSAPRPRPERRKAPKFKVTMKMTRKNARSIKRRNLTPGKCVKKEIVWVMKKKREFAENARILIVETQKPVNKQNRQLLAHSVKAVLWTAGQLVYWPWRGVCNTVFTAKEISLYLALLSQRIALTGAYASVAAAALVHILKDPKVLALIMRSWYPESSPPSVNMNNLRWYTQ